VTGPVTFTTTGSTTRATLSRAGVTYATGTAQTTRGGTRLLLTQRRTLRPGRYTLALTSHHGTRQTTTHQQISVA
jgi:hypothetical protein